MAMTFWREHEDALALLALAVIACMPDELPASLRALPAWLWVWLAKSLKTFSSFRSPTPKPPQPPAP
jgi:hypothetical protein